MNKRTRKGRDMILNFSFINHRFENFEINSLPKFENKIMPKCIRNFNTNPVLNPRKVGPRNEVFPAPDDQ